MLNRFSAKFLITHITAARLHSIVILCYRSLCAGKGKNIKCATEFKERFALMKLAGLTRSSLLRQSRCSSGSSRVPTTATIEHKQAKKFNIALDWMKQQRRVVNERSVELRSIHQRQHKWTKRPGTRAGTNDVQTCLMISQWWHLMCLLSDVIGALKPGERATYRFLPKWAFVLSNSRSAFRTHTRTTSGDREHNKKIPSTIECRSSNWNIIAGERVQ